MLKIIGVNAERIEKFDYSCRLGEKLQAGMTRGRTLVYCVRNAGSRFFAYSAFSGIHFTFHSLVPLHVG